MKTANQQTNEDLENEDFNYSDDSDEDFSNPQEQFLDLYTDGTGNCFSDADPGL